MIKTRNEGNLAKNRQNITKTEKQPSSLMSALGLLGLGLSVIAIALAIMAMVKVGDTAKDMNEKIKAIVFGVAQKAGLDVEKLKKDMEATCKELGLSMTTAFTIFAKKMTKKNPL